MERRKIWGTGLFLMLGLILLTQVPQAEENGLEEGLVNASFHDMNSSHTSWAVLEIADNDTERQEGLMNVTELGERRGMLFVFEEEEMRGFWMKNTLIPLDMIFLDAEKQVINVETAGPEPGTADENLTVYRSEKPAKYVIEVNAGFAENYSITKGTEVSLGH
jgi:uncharacterized membrane protein (UPF0127 family)